MRAEQQSVPQAVFDQHLYRIHAVRLGDVGVQVRQVGESVLERSDFSRTGAADDHEKIGMPFRGVRDRRGGDVGNLRERMLTAGILKPGLDDDPEPGAGEGGEQVGREVQIVPGIGRQEFDQPDPRLRFRPLEFAAPCGDRRVQDGYGPDVVGSARCDVEVVVEPMGVAAPGGVERRDADAVHPIFFQRCAHPAQGARDGMGRPVSGVGVDVDNHGVLRCVDFVSDRAGRTRAAPVPRQPVRWVRRRPTPAEDGQCCSTGSLS